MLEKMDNNDEDWMTPIKVERYAEMEEEWQRPYSVLKKNDEGDDKCYLKMSELSSLNLRRISIPSPTDVVLV
jgi:hypothetical protein